MSKGRNVPTEVRRRIGELAQEDPFLSPGQIKLRLDKEFDGTDLFVPGPDSIRKTVKTVRDHMRDRDSLWSIGASDYGIPSDALKDVLGVWKRCVTSRRPFTVRQARWVARLREVVSIDGRATGLQDLYEWASLYAAREIVADALNLGGVETSDLDAKLAFKGASYWALVRTNRVTYFSVDDRLEHLRRVAPEQASYEAFRDWAPPGEQRPKRLAGFAEGWTALSAAFDRLKQLELREEWQRTELIGEAWETHAIWVSELGRTLNLVGFDTSPPDTGLRWAVLVDLANEIIDSIAMTPEGLATIKFDRPTDGLLSRAGELEERFE